MEPAGRTEDKFDSGEVMTRYIYNQKAFDHNGESVEVEFSAGKQLRKGAYLMLYIKKENVVTSYDEVEWSEIPSKAQIAQGCCMKSISNSEKVLIIDDEEDILKLLSTVLYREGLGNIYTARDAASGYALFESIDPDIIILDIMLPDGDGYEICKKIRLTSNVPILFMSAKTEEIDQVLIKRVINNIVHNAIVHNDEGVSILVQVEKKEDIHILIKDKGKGIEEEEIKHIFNRYYRGTNTGVKHKGSGLGMAIAKDIVESHNGSIHIKSQLGVGTEIEIIL